VVLSIWCFGVLVMLAYALVSYVKLKREVAASIQRIDNVYVCDGIKSPFILGVIRPQIYLPSGMKHSIESHVIAHEKAHLNRKDYLWKPLGYLLLAVYWFQPILWFAYILFCRDIEAACDERVIADFDRESKASYSEALLACAMQHKRIAVCPLAFGETDVKGRVKNVLRYKKPAFWGMFAAVAVCMVVAVCFLTNPSEPVQCVMVRGERYYFTGERSSLTSRCGNMDGTIDSTCAANKLPTQDNQGNFGAGYGYQRTSGDTIEIQLDDKAWYVFARKKS
jgi:beta-lactamase regulating signal transducer with metallopeptidase domain